MKENISNAFILILIFLVVVAIPLVPADFSLGDNNYSISKIYGPEMDIRGWINISLKNELEDSVFEYSFGAGTDKSEITLGEILESDPSFDYSCTPVDCETSYTVIKTGDESKSFNMDEGDSKIVGFKLSGTLTDITSIDFEIESDGRISKDSQIKIDILDNGRIDMINNRSSSMKSYENYGCFDSSKETGKFLMRSNPTDTYCQRINLTQSPGFRLGAWIDHIDGDPLDILAKLFDLNRNPIGECTIKNVDKGGEYHCDIDYIVVEPQDHFVCISPDTQGEEESRYEIRGYGSTDPEEVCGFHESLSSEREEVSAMQIFAHGRQFALFQTMKITDELPHEEQTLSDKMWEYLKIRYGVNEGKISCPSGEGCIIPINLISSVDQAVTLRNLDLIYEAVEGPTSKDSFYELESSAPSITSEPEFQRLFLDNAGISVPAEIGNYTFIMEFKGDEIIHEDIEVKYVPIVDSLKPISTAAGFDTEFEVETTAPENQSIIDYTWRFYDEDGNLTRTDSTSQNKINHTYINIGNYTLEIEVTDTRGLGSSETFKIEARSPKDHIESSLNQMEKNLETIREDIQGQSSFRQRSLNSILNTDSLESEIKSLRDRFDAAENDTDYMDMVGDVIDLRVPQKIRLSTVIDSFPFVPEGDSIEMSVIEAIGGGEYNPGRERDYKNAVISWQHGNIDSEVSFGEFSAEYDSGREHLANMFEFSVSEKRDIAYDYYFIVPRLQGIEFEGEVEEQGNYLYVNLRDKSKVSFYTTEDVDFENIPAFISPSINQLDVERTIVSQDDESRVMIFVLSIIFLIVIGIVAYIILQQWYKKKYENYLFPNRNDLYNLVNYVNSAKKRGLKKSEIREKLRKTDWGSEQIRYVLRKYEGRRTGMIELPFTKTLDKKIKEKDRSSSHNNHKPHHWKR